VTEELTKNNEAYFSAPALRRKPEFKKSIVAPEGKKGLSKDELVLI